MFTTKRSRILLADDHRMVLDGLRRLLENEFELVGAVEDGLTLLSAAQRLRPDVILLDISLPSISGIEAARRLRSIVPASKIIFVTMHSDSSYIAEATRIGASGYVLKRYAGAVLVEAIRTVVRGGTYVTPSPADGVNSAARAVPAASPQAPPARVTLRQTEVLQLVAAGKSNKEIAGSLGISVKTAEFHKTRLMNALDLHSVADLTRYAIRQGLVSA